MSEIPQWKEENIGNKLKLLSGFPFFSSRFSTEEGMPLIRIRDVLDSKIETYYTGSYLPMYVIRQGDILIGMDGDFHISKWNNQDALLNQRVLKIDVLDSNEMDLEFIFYWLQPFIKKINDITAATTVKHLSVKDVKKAKGKIPKKPVQTKIGVILSNIDRAIESTQALIEKYQLIKAGLIHDLFTRGIGADGKLRPPREEAPELYQETAIGWIPKEWELSTCFDICESIIDCKNRTPPITPSGYPVIRTPNVRNGLFIDEQLVFTDEKSYIIWTARGKPKVDDVVITREAPVGEVCKIPKHHPNACLGQRMMLYRTDSQKIENDFFLYMLQSRQIQNRLDLISGGSTVGHVRVGDIRSLYAFYPKNSSEQQKIAEMLNKSSEKFGSETNSLEKLRKQKAGLMHDLLTGKVQVNVGETEAVDG